MISINEFICNRVFPNHFVCRKYNKVNFFGDSSAFLTST